MMLEYRNSRLIKASLPSVKRRMQATAKTVARMYQALPSMNRNT